jgi:LPS O-antigen subunit length determinant protein (WzzB/FepE family)
MGTDDSRNHGIKPGQNNNPSIAEKNGLEKGPLTDSTESIESSPMKVIVRIRPFNETELAIRANAIKVVQANDDTRTLQVWVL